MDCPICRHRLPPPERDEAGVDRWYCDCAGFRRTVIAVFPSERKISEVDEADIVSTKKKGLKQNDRSD